MILILTLLMLLTSLTGCTPCQFYGGSEITTLIAKITKKWNLHIMGTGESNPDEYLEYFGLSFNSHEKRSFQEAKAFIIEVTQDILIEINKCPKLKSRLEYKHFTIQNLDITISYSDANYKKHPACYAASSYLSRNGLMILSQDEYGYVDQTLREGIPPELLEGCEAPFYNPI